MVPPLSLPEQATVATPEAIAHYEAVDLFAGPRHVGTIRLRADPGQRTGGRHPVPRAGRNPAGHRACRCQDQGAVAAGDLRQPRRATDGAQPGLPRRRGPAPVTARLRRVVLRPVHPARAAVLGAVLGVHRRIRPGGRGRRLCCRRPARRGGPRPDERTRRPVGRPRRGSRPRAHAVPHAHRHPAVRPRAGREGRRAARHAGAPRHLVRRPGLPVRRRRLRAAPDSTGCGGYAWSTRTCGPPSTTSRGQPRTPRPAWSWRRSSTCTGPPPDCSTRHATGWRSGWPRAPGRRRSEPSRWPWRPGSRSFRTTGSGPGS